MKRFRRLRTTEQMRSFVRETTVNVEDLIYPLFVAEGTDRKDPVPSMPGIFQFSLDRLDEEVSKVVDAGIPAVLRPTTRTASPREPSARSKPPIPGCWSSRTSASVNTRVTATAASSATGTS